MRLVQSPRDMPYLRAMLAGLHADTLAAPGVLSPAPGETAVIAARAHSYAHADLYWATTEMARLALDASHDMPGWTPAAVWPSPSGVLAWPESALPPIAWLPVPGVLQMPACPPLSMAWAVLPGGVLEVGVQVSAHHATGRADTRGRHMPATMITVPATETFDPDGAATSHGYMRAPSPAALLAWLGAAWVMMQQPQVVQRRTIEPARRDMEQARRDGVPAPYVTTVDLRPLRHTPTSDEPGTSGRRLSVRHLVRGHWRQQYHPSDGTHRPLWIHSYLKGPADAPLQLTEQVMVWRR